MLLFFKQKTAYEMRISDWSSDVCSSDLLGLLVAAVAAERADRGEVAALRPAGDRLRVDLEQRTDLGRGEQWLVVERGHVVPFGWGSYSSRQRLRRSRSSLRSGASMNQTPRTTRARKTPARSAETTSELKSLMRI